MWSYIKIILQKMGSMPQQAVPQSPHSLVYFLKITGNLMEITGDDRKITGEIRETKKEINQRK